MAAIAFATFLNDNDLSFDLERQPVAGFVEGADPVLAALQREQLLNQGADPSQLGGRGAPVLRFLQFPRTQGPFTADFNTSVFQNAASAVSRIVGEGTAQGLSDGQIRQNVLDDPNIANQFQGFRENAAVGAGFSSFEDFINSQIQFERDRPEEAARSRALLDDVRAGQDASTRGISQILQDFPVPTQARIDELAGTFTDDFRRDRLQRANAGGFPADLRNIEREGLQQAIGILAGQQQIAGNALGAFRGDQTARIAQGLGVAERGQAGQLGAAQLAGTQAIALSGLQSQQDIADFAAEEARAKNASDANLKQQQIVADFLAKAFGGGAGGGGGAPAGGG